ncbi:MAG TPA: hypothetical protein VMZ53_31135 [Kofleriaceae bacterium]|nr:hypothetical protein [Kofleriaceae bacterium]
MRRAAVATMLVVALAAFAGAMFVGCKPRKTEPNGVANYRFGKTTRANIFEGICQPTELTDGRKATWCFALPPLKVAKRVAEVDAYFLGQETEANSKLPEKDRRPALEKMPLIEVQFKVRGCVESEAENFLRERFGPPDVKQSKGALTVWQNSFMWVGAFLPSEPGRCLIHFLPMSEAAEIARIKAKAAGGAPTPEPTTPSTAPSTETPPPTATGSSAGSAQ